MRSLPTSLAAIALLAGCSDFDAAFDPEAPQPDRQIGGYLAPVTDTDPEPAEPQPTTDSDTSNDDPETPDESRLVRLTLGTALAQTLPSGTAMGFSVEYEFLATPPPGSYHYALVVRDARGQTHVHPVPPSDQPQGTIAFFVTTWKPDQAPFEALLVMTDGQTRPRPVSNTVDLR